MTIEAFALITLISSFLFTAALIGGSAVWEEGGRNERHI
jgi:hypothetical protein